MTQKDHHGMVAHLILIIDILYWNGIFTIGCIVLVFSWLSTLQKTFQGM